MKNKKGNIRGGGRQGGEEGGDRVGRGESGYRSGRGKRIRGEDWRVVFWNVAGLGNKDREF